MHPEIILGSMRLNSYWVVTYLSFIPVAVYSYWIGIYVERVPRKRVILFIALLFAVQYFGGAAAGFFYKWYQSGAIPREVPFWESGRYYHSVLLTSMLFFVLYWGKERPVMRLLDCFAVGASMMSAIGRIGCFLQGCCRGKTASGFLGMHFPNLPEAVYPTQLYHLFFEGFLLLPFLLFLQRRKRFDGETFWVYLFIYSVFRFFIEFLRVNPVTRLGLTHAQIVSLLIILLADYGWLKGIDKKTSGKG